MQIEWKGMAKDWEIQKDELELSDFGPQTQGRAWRKTLRRIKR